MSAENNPNDAEGRPHANPRQGAVPDAPAPALNPEASAQPQTAGAQPQPAGAQPDDAQPGAATTAASTDSARTKVPTPSWVVPVQPQPESARPEADQPRPTSAQPGDGHSGAQVPANPAQPGMPVDARHVQPQPAQSQPVPAPSAQPQLAQSQPVQPQPAQPQYGQIRQPEYGQMASQYPGWDPYVFGRPEPKEGEDAGDVGSGAASNAASQTSAPAQARPGVVQRPPLSQQQLGFNPYPYGAPEQPGDGGNADGARGQIPEGPRMGAPGQGGAFGQGGANDSRFVMQPVDLDDPNQNPLYGRWDTMAIVAMVCAWMFPPVGLVLALFSMRRTRVFHMRGRALAIAALVIAIINTIVDVIVSIYGIGWYVNWVYQLTGVDMSQMLNSMGLDAGSVGGSDGSVSA